MRISDWSSDVCSSDLFALETGEEEPIESARALLATAVSLADNAENIPLWWISSLCRHLIDDLWQHSLHQSLPTEPPEGTEEKYPDLRRPFIRSEEHTSELQSLMRISYAVFCLKKKKTKQKKKETEKQTQHVQH